MIFINIFYLPIAMAEEEFDLVHLSQEREHLDMENESEDEFYTALGIVAVAFGLATVSIYFLRIVNKVFWKNKNTFFINIRKYLKLLHPYMGILLIIVSGIHGYGLLGEDEASLGLAAWIALVIIILSTFGKMFKAKIWLNIHKFSTVIFFFLLFFHLSD